MAILEKEVWVTLSGSNIKHYEDLGYKIPRYINNRNDLKFKRGSQIFVNIEDVQKNSNKVKITRVCDECKEYTPSIRVADIFKNRKEGIDRCKSCVRKYVGRKQRNSVRYDKSLESYAKENKLDYLLDEFSEKNTIPPNQISFGTAQEFLWKCKKCSSEYQMKVCTRTNKLNLCGCPYCSGKRINIKNCLWSTHPDIAFLLKDENKGYIISSGSNAKEIFVCSECGFEQRKTVDSVTRQGFSCTKCSDGVSYPEKFMAEVFNQAGVGFEREKVFDWSKNTDTFWKYDFYIPSLNCIVETHGEQHFRNSTRGRSLEEEQENDRIKEKIARKNGISNYIIIDCSSSELLFIKNNINKSVLPKLLMLEQIDWQKCDAFAVSSMIKRTCDLWNGGIRSTIKISEMLNIHYGTVSRYLKRGVNLGLCNYDPIKARGENKNHNKIKKKVVKLSLDGIFISEYNSITEATKELKGHTTLISGVCKGKRISAYGYKWMYKEDYEKYLEDQKQLVSQSYIK